MNNKFLNSDIWDEPIILYSGLLSESDSISFIENLSKSDVLLATRCLNSRFEKNEHLHNVVFSRAKFGLKQLNNIEFLSKSFLSIIELQELEYLKSRLLRFGYSRVESKKSRRSLKRKIVRYILDNASEKSIDRFVFEFTENTNSPFIGELTNELFNRDYQLHQNSRANNNMVNLLNNSYLKNHKNRIFVLGIISPSFFHKVDSHVDSYISDIKSNHIRLNVSRIKNIYKIISKFNLNEAYPVQFLIHLCASVKKNTVTSALLSAVVLNRDFDRLFEIIEHYISTESYSEFVEVLTLNRSLNDAICSYDFKDYKNQLIQKYSKSNSDIVYTFLNLLANIRSFKIGDQVNCKVVGVEKGLVTLSVNSCYTKVITFYSQLSPKVKRNFSKKKGSITFRGKIVSYNRLSYVVARDENFSIK